VSALHKLRKALGEAWTIGSNHERPTMETLNQWREVLSERNIADQKVRTAEEILRSIVSDVEAMRKSGQHWFGPFPDSTGEGLIYWPNLGILCDEAREVIK